VPAYRRTVRSVFKYWNLPNAVPYLEWMRYPTTMLPLARGCTLDCSTCGGSRSAYRLFCNRQTPAYRSPEKLVADVRTIESFSRAPVFVVGDPRMEGHARVQEFFDLLAKHKPRNEMVFELFYPANERLFEMIERSVPRWNLQITIESPLQHLRQLNGKFGCSNEEAEATIASALAHGCSKLDIFYMVGIPAQTVADAMATIPYCDALADKLGNDPQVHFFVAPLAPSLDPGSRAFEDPAFGYKHYARTLEEHRQALNEPVWDRVLSFDSDAMSRAEIVSSTYAVAEGLNDLKLRHGLIDAPTHAALALELEAATTAMRELETAARLGPVGREQAIERAQQAIAASRLASMRGKEELHWHDQVSFRVTPRLLFDVVTGPLDQFVLGLGRALGRYDRHVYSPRLEWSPEGA
jgi:B12-binding domain/radical SAM domain protein